MGALVLGVLLVIGYFIESHHPIKRFKLARSTGYHIYFKAGLSGFLAVLASLTIWIVVDFFDLPSSLIESSNLSSHITFLNGSNGHWDELKVFFVFFLAFCLCYLYVLISKKIFSDEKKYLRIKELANDLELLVINSETEVEPIRLELDSGKVYVGIAQSPDLDKGNVAYINLIPLLSGYTSETKELIFNNNYYKHYEEQFDNNTHDDLLDGAKSFLIVIPVSEIVVASKFDIAAFIAFRNAGPSELVGPPKPIND